MSSLYELTGDWLKLQDMLESEDFDKETIKTTIECMEYEIEIKANNYGKLIKNLEINKKSIEGTKKAIQEEIKRLNDKEKAIENKIRFLKENLGNTMRIMKKNKIKTEFFTFYFTKTKKVNILDNEKALNSKYIRNNPEIDKIRLLKAMENGEIFDFADIKESESLVIR
jgi:ribosomal protein L16 Arg81 hydroxylase